MYPVMCPVCTAGFAGADLCGHEGSYVDRIDQFPLNTVYNMTLDIANNSSAAAYFSRRLSNFVCAYISVSGRENQ